MRTNEGRACFGLAALDISTGAFALSETDEAGLAAEIARLEPSEIVASQGVYDEAPFARLIAEMRVPVTPLAREAGDGAAAERRVCEFYGVETLDGFGAFTRAEIAAAALALAYVKRTQLEARPALSPPTRRARGTSLEIDPATRANLELTRTLSGAREGSLLATIDLTVTPRRRAASRRAAGEPADRSERDQRAARCRSRFLVEAAPIREALRRELKGAPDFLRALSRLSLDRGGPRDLAAVRDGLAAAAALARDPRDGRRASRRASRAHTPRFEPIAARCNADLAKTLADELPLVKRDGGFVRAGRLPPRSTRRGRCATRAGG